jgi:hypothetical protein
MSRRFLEPDRDALLVVGGTFGEGDLVCRTQARCLPRLETAQQLGLRLRCTVDGDTREVRLERTLTA